MQMFACNFPTYKYEIPCASDIGNILPMSMLGTVLLVKGEERNFLHDRKVVQHCC